MDLKNFLVVVKLDVFVSDRLRFCMGDFKGVI